MVEERLTLDHCRIIWKNFSGRTSQFNPPMGVNKKGSPVGRRSFHIIIEDEERALELKDMGWNIKYHEGKTPDQESIYTLEAFMKFDKYPPKITMVCGSTMTLLDEELIDDLDNADIINGQVMVQLQPYNWENATGNSGTKAYVKVAYIPIEEDPFAQYFQEDDGVPF